MRTTEQKKTYDSILKLYDYAEELVDAVERPDTPNPEKEFRVVEPLVRQLEECATMLAEAYITFLNTGGQVDPELRSNAETALRRLFSAIEMFKRAGKINNS